MARCDQGYLCRVCGDEVEEITESTLYLRYVIGEIDPEVLHLAPESHLRCHPTLAQFISDPRVGPLAPLASEFALSQLDPEYVTQRRELISRGYERLWEIRGARARIRTVQEYPLPEVIERWRK
jgi:hypothetical protein